MGVEVETKRLDVTGQRVVHLSKKIGRSSPEGEKGTG